MFRVEADGKTYYFSPDDIASIGHTGSQHNCVPVRLKSSPKNPVWVLKSDLPTVLEALGPFTDVKGATFNGETE